MPGVLLEYEGGPCGWRRVTEVEEDGVREITERANWSGQALLKTLAFTIGELGCP